MTSFERRRDFERLLKTQRLYLHHPDLAVIVSHPHPSSFAFASKHPHPDFYGWGSDNRDFFYAVIQQCASDFLLAKIESSVHARPQTNRRRVW